MTMLLLPPQGGNPLESLEPVLMEAVLGFSAGAKLKMPGDAIVLSQPTELSLEGADLAYTIEILVDGDYALFTQHHPDEFQAKLLGVGGEQAPTI